MSGPASTMSLTGISWNTVCLTFMESPNPLNDLHFFYIYIYLTVYSSAMPEDTLWDREHSFTLDVSKSSPGSIFEIRANRVTE